MHKSYFRLPETFFSKFNGGLSGRECIQSHVMLGSMMEWHHTSVLSFYCKSISVTILLVSPISLSSLNASTNKGVSLLLYFSLLCRNTSKRCQMTTLRTTLRHSLLRNWRNPRNLLPNVQGIGKRFSCGNTTLTEVKKVIFF